MEDWHNLVRESVTISLQVRNIIGIEDRDIEKLEALHEEFSIRVNPYYLSLCKEKGDPIWLQSIPDKRELTGFGMEDPLGEENDTPVPNITHR